MSYEMVFDLRPNGLDVGKYEHNFPLTGLQIRVSKETRYSKNLCGFYLIVQNVRGRARKVQSRCTVQQNVDSRWTI